MVQFIHRKTKLIQEQPSLVWESCVAFWVRASVESLYVLSQRKLTTFVLKMCSNIFYLSFQIRWSWCAGVDQIRFYLSKSVEKFQRQHLLNLSHCFCGKRWFFASPSVLGITCVINLGLLMVLFYKSATLICILLGSWGNCCVRQTSKTQWSMRQ